MKIIAFGHRRRVGKDTCADFLFCHIKTLKPGLQVYLGGFADAVKQVAYQTFSWAGLQKGIHYENHPEEKERVLPKLGISPRDIWIFIGETLRKVCATIWVELLMENVPSNTDVLIIKDLRKLPEAEFIRGQGGELHKVVRDVPQFPDPVDSELEYYDAWVSVIGNQGTKKQLSDLMFDMAKRITGVE